ncbi:MAG: hypothetical protein JNL88_11855 [Bacteroidia bacterium]|nr:hypothetical protein [Bacteroidia bacterium]
MDMKSNFILKAVLGFAAIFLMVGLVVMYLWNWLMPELLQWPSITFLQALGLLLLSKILFGGGGSHIGRKWKGAWGEHMKTKMEAMSPEERERFRQQWEERCGKWKKEA